LLKLVLLIILITSTAYSDILSKKQIFQSEIKLASLLKDYEYYDKALSSYQGLTKKNQSVSLYMDLGVLYKMMGKNKEAEKIILNAIKEKPRNQELINALGDIYFENENYKEARKYLLKIKNNKKAINRLALIENRDNNYKKAIGYYKILVEKYKENFQRVNLAILYQKFANIEAAEKELLLFYENSKDKYYAKKYLIRFYRKYNKKEKLQAFIKSLKIKNDKKKKMRPLLKSRW